jgi:hypothetical protein
MIILLKGLIKCSTIFILLYAVYSYRIHYIVCFSGQYFLAYQIILAADLFLVLLGRFTCVRSCHLLMRCTLP